MDQRSDRSDLEARVSELETTLAELRRELEPRRGPFGLPPPPRPETLFRFTEQYALPTAIALLEAQIRTLEGLRAVLRGMEGKREASERVERTRTRAESVGRETLAALDAALADLQDAVRTGGLPNSPAAQNLLADARRLTDEIESELERGRTGPRDGRDVDPVARERDPEVVEEELRILRDEFADEDGDAGGSRGDDTGGDPGDDTTSGTDGPAA